MVAENANKEGYIREKYNVVTRSTVANVTAGYASNVVGFGWTNGTFLVLLHELSAREQQSILNESARSGPRPGSRQLAHALAQDLGIRVEE